MHEYSLTQGILDIAIEHAGKNNATRILRVNVKIGGLMAIVEDSMQFFFEYLSADTLAKGAELLIENVPIMIRCSNCGAESEVSQFEIYKCPECGEMAVKLVSGREFYIDSIEIE